MNQAEGAKQLVERARAGDQNAMGMIAMVGENARKGNPKARSAFMLIQEFINNHPAGSIMGAEQQSALGVLKEPRNPLQVVYTILCQLPMMGDEQIVNAACVILANGRPWNKPTVKSIDASLGHEVEKNLFRYGVDYANNEKKLRPIGTQLPPEAIGHLCAGHCIGTARKIQLARLPQVPVSVLSPDIGWELGC
jgi:hypothetical protein